ncbi:MAG: hypothetical protein GDA52_04920 [Rhodobacteraceae bacterium]|nr:hypothetical protein [Paracoccaceae bacterium]
MPLRSDLDAFYAVLDDLEARVGGRRRLGDCHGRMRWPRHGVYFFFEPGEHRTTPSAPQRVVRVGTHAMAAKSRTTLWNRLSQHRGTKNPSGGNHRGSIFRLLVGEALLNADPSLNVESWGQGSTAPRDVREQERPHEVRVNRYLGEMTLLVLDVLDAPGPDSARGIIERNSIALLSSYRSPALDLPGPRWLGNHSGREKVRKSGLWNNTHVNETYDPEFLNLFDNLTQRMP